MPIDMPTGFIVRSSFWLEAHTQAWESQITRNTQTAILGGSRWRADYTIRKQKRSEVGVWQAFLAALDGRFGTFNAYDPDRKAPQGVGTGTPLVNGAGQTGTSLNIDGATPNVLNWLRAGDLFSVNGELKMATANVNTNGSGQATIPFRPALRNPPADNAPLTLTLPTCTMRLESDQEGMFDAGLTYYEEKTFSAVEVFA